MQWSRLYPVESLLASNASMWLLGFMKRTGTETGIGPSAGPLLPSPLEVAFGGLCDHGRQ